MSETNDSTFCEDGDHFKIVREGSRYQELKNRMEELQHESDVAQCSNVSHSEREDVSNDLDQAIHEVRAFESGDAGSFTTACLTILRWFPCWGHGLCVLMQMGYGNYMSAWFALAAALFAFMWLNKSKGVQS